MIVKRKAQAFDLEKFLTTVDGGGSLKVHAKGDVIFAQDDAAHAVFFIIEGRVKIAMSSSVGKEAIVAVLGERDFFGESCLIQPQRPATAAAMNDCVIMRLPKALMIRTLRNERKFADMFLAHLITRMSRVEEDLADQLFSPSEKRLARILLLLANGKDGNGARPIAHISQETLAAMVGTTRPRVSFFMNRFKKQGFVEYNGTISVRSSLSTVL